MVYKHQQLAFIHIHFNKYQYLLLYFTFPLLFIVTFLSFFIIAIVISLTLSLYLNSDSQLFFEFLKFVELFQLIMDLVQIELVVNNSVKIHKYFNFRINMDFLAEQVKAARFQLVIALPIQIIKVWEILDLVLTFKALNKWIINSIPLIKHFASIAASFVIIATKYITTIEFAFTLISHCFYQPKFVWTSCQLKGLMNLFPRVSLYPSHLNLEELLLTLLLLLLGSLPRDLHYLIECFELAANLKYHY